MTPWRSQVIPIKDGEQVAAKIANRPLLSLSAQAQHLKEKVDDLSGASGRLVFANAPLGAETVPLDVVYFDPGSMSFLPALAEVIQDPSGGRTVCGPRSHAVGVVISKSSSTIGDVLQIGRINMSEAGLDVSDMLADPINETFAPGRFYLSSKIPGKVTSAPVMPAIQVGFLSEGESNIQILHKDLFESHQHHRFVLSPKPSASQNFDQTGWSSLGVSGSEAIKRVDYFNSGVSATPPQIIMCIRHPGGNPISEDAPVRVEIYNDGGQLAIDVVSGGILFNDPSSSGLTTTTSSRQWPEYGEWIGVGSDTGLEVAFVRADGDYANSLADDADSLLDSDTKRFLVFLPSDLQGWTNANPFDITHPAGALYRYLLNGDTELQAAFPPLPVSSAFIEMNGASMVPGVDFEVTLSGIFWKIGFVTPSDYAPWPSDYSAVDSMSPENGKNLVLHFIKSGMDAMESVVFSLKGIAPIKVTRCPGGGDAVAGHLQVSIDLGLITSTADAVNMESVLGSVLGVEFQKSLVVSELFAGPGISLENITPNASLPDRKVGRVRISSRQSKFEGEISSILLRNAKESLGPFGSYVDFILVFEGASGITAQFQIPSFDLDLNSFTLAIFAKVRGSLAVAASSPTLQAVFKVAYHVIRPGFVMSAMNDINAIVVQHWIVPFNPGYMASQILLEEYPRTQGSPAAFDINAATLTANPNSLVALDGGFKAGDRFAVNIDRVNSDGSGNSSSYTGRVGFAGLRWVLK